MTKIVKRNMSVANALQVTFNNEDISTAHRLQAPKNRNFHASIVVQFARRSVRASWLTAAKKKKLQTTDLHSSLKPAPVFVVEHLSPHNRELLQEAKAMVRENKLAYAWCSNGKILVRKSENSRAVRIFRSINELEDSN
ncbi:hypothetical protein J6590_069477 [Homalodisca vitripennis]|nr:hypothetical protein J6590_069477 [Homalodisca vitripennis]